MNRRVQATDEISELISSMKKRAEIGFSGELKVDRVWQEIILPPTSLLIHDFETVNDVGNPHQIDTLFCCEHFILIIEIKNVSGIITYDEEKHQFLRKRKDGEIASFQSPIEQLKRHRDLIERIIHRIGLTIPIEKAVVIAEPSTIIGNFKSDIPIFHAAGLPTRLKKLFEKYPDPLSAPHFQLLKEQIIKMHKPRVYKPPFDIPPIRKGPICHCGQVMSYKYGSFVCACGMKSKEPLFQGLHDYRVLINEWITNQQFREFFFIKSSDAANKILKRLEFYYEGTTKDRRYLIPKDIWRK